MLLLADELFCIAHDDRTGRSRCHPRVLGLGLAAGLLGELVLFGRVVIEDGAVRVVDRDPPPDVLAHQTLAVLLAQPQHSDVRTWLAYLAETAVDSVADRLIVAGVWHRDERRRLGRVRMSFAPVDSTAVVWRSVRLARLLTSREAVPEPDAALAGLVAITGLANEVLWMPETRDEGMARVSELVTGLPWPLYHLLAFTEAAIGDVVLSPR